MKFNNVHGTGISLSEGRTTATRSDANFCNGIVFGDVPLKVGQKVALELTCAQNWSGALRIGFTTVDPARTTSNDLPKYAIPYYSRKEGYWVRQISEGLAADKSQLMLYVSSDGVAQFFINNEHMGALFAGLPAYKPLWIMLDVYGNTKGVKLIRADDAPKEITARGPEAIKAFESACQSGMMPVYKTRLMVVGQDRVGKTSLKKALLGQKYDVNEKPTSGIDISTSCTVCLGNHGNWTPSGQETQTDNCSNCSNQAILSDVEALEEEFNQAIAANIVQELLYQKRRKASSSQKPRNSATKDTHRVSASGPKKLSSKPSSATMSAKFSEIPTEMFKEVPSGVVELVQKMLDNTPDTKSQDSVSIATKARENMKLVLNIWDFAGREAFYTTHQIFLASRAVYMIVFNLTHNLQDEMLDSQYESGMSALEHLDFWMRSIFAHASTTSKNTSDNNVYSPPIFIVGTHRNSLGSDRDSINNAVEEKISQIQEFLVGKPYVQHVVTPFFAVDNSLDDDLQMNDLRLKIEEIASHESYIGERMPVKWIKFEQELSKLVAQGNNYASYDQITEIAGHLDITDYSEVMTMLEFYHDLGVIVYYGSGPGTLDNQLRNTVLLKPQWLIDMFRLIVCSHDQPQDKWNLIRDKWTRLEEFGILEESLLDTLWSEARDQKMVLLGLLEKFDLVCQRLPSMSELQTSDDLNKSYYVPSRLSCHNQPQKLYTTEEKDVAFFINFHGYLPAEVFLRILTRTVRWSQGHGGQNPYYMYRNVARFYLDVEHDFILEMAAKHFHRLKVVVLRVADPSTPREEKGNKSSAPDPEACAKVRNFLESTLTELKEAWLKRISYSMCAQCPCDRVCETHKKEGCTHESCIHLLNLDECLTNKVVMCEHRRIKTGNIKKGFPEPLALGFNGPVLPPMALIDSCGNIEKHCPFLPSWVKSAAKRLNTGDSGKDWHTLAQELGYKQNQINSFNDDLNPGLALLADWIITSGNTGLSVDMLTVYLDKLDREDVSEVIHKAQESEHQPAQIFISYQWDSQDDVKLMRDRLERSGFTCWMDVGQLGGGDQLYTKIDQALRSCKAVIACVSPRYTVSSHCMKELSLADLLRKPIIPVMVEKTVWPPPGGMALIFSQLVYINMKGIGGHGGTGIHADRDDKYKEIVQRLSLYAVPDLSRCAPLEIDTESKMAFIDDSESLVYAGNEPELIGSRSGLSMVHHQNERIRPSSTSVPERRTVEQVHVDQCRICTLL